MSLVLYLVAGPGIVCFFMVRWLRAAGRYNTFRLRLHPDAAHMPSIDDVAAEGIIGTYKGLDRRRSEDDRLVRSGALGPEPQALLAEERATQTAFFVSMFIALALVAFLTNAVPAIASAMDISADAVATVILLALGWMGFATISVRAARQTISSKGPPLYVLGYLGGIVIVGIVASIIGARILGVS